MRGVLRILNVYENLHLRHGSGYTSVYVTDKYCLYNLRYVNEHILEFMYLYSNRLKAYGVEIVFVQNSQDVVRATYVFLFKPQ